MVFQSIVKQDYLRSGIAAALISPAKPDFLAGSGRLMAGVLRSGLIILKQKKPSQKMVGTENAEADQENQRSISQVSPCVSATLPDSSGFALRFSNPT